MLSDAEIEIEESARAWRIKPRRPNRKRGFRSKFEARIAQQLQDEGVPFTFEKSTFLYVKYWRVLSYTPDFHVNKAFYVEAKGYFLGQDADRRKLILVKEQNPERDLRLLFQQAGRLIGKWTGMTYADWAEAHGFPWAGGGSLPRRWIEEAMDGGHVAA